MFAWPDTALRWRGTHYGLLPLNETENALLRLSRRLRGFKTLQLCYIPIKMAVDILYWSPPTLQTMLYCK